MAIRGEKDEGREEKDAMNPREMELLLLLRLAIYRRDYSPNSFSFYFLLILIDSARDEEYLIIPYYIGRNRKETNVLCTVLD